MKLNRGQKTLLLLIGLTAAPFILAQLAFNYYHDSGTARPTVNKGTLVTPAAKIDALKLESLPGPVLATNKWRLLYFRPAQCDATCQASVQRVRAMPSLVGRDANRVAVAMIVADESVASSATENPEPALPRVKARAALPGIRDGLLLVDPQGNVVLWYDAERIGGPVLSDLKFLLKNSSIG